MWLVVCFNPIEKEDAIFECPAYEDMRHDVWEFLRDYTSFLSIFMRTETSATTKRLFLV
jgi:hypothetical protein